MERATSGRIRTAEKKETRDATMPAALSGIKASGSIHAVECGNFYPSRQERKGAHKTEYLPKQKASRCGAHLEVR
jgi:hypothetical protein